MPSFCKFIFIIIFLQSISSLAEDCNAVDLRSEVLGPPRDHYSYGWCYAMTAADLLTQSLYVKASGIDKDSDLPQSKLGTAATFEFLGKLDELEQHQKLLNRIYSDGIPEGYKCQKNPVEYLFTNLNLDDYTKILKETPSASIATAFKRKNCRDRLRCQFFS